MSRKGITLPINLIVILAVAVIVLVTLLALYFGVIPPGQQAMGQRAQFDACCLQYINKNPTCQDSAVNFNCPESKKTLGTLAGNLNIGKGKVGNKKEKAIKKACGCPIT